MSAFFKVEGLGNDFMLLDGTLADIPDWQQRAPQLCDRRRGVGGDGILVVGPPLSASADASMWVVNHDGSRPEMCGNGLRCVALWCAARAGTQRVVIDTDDGPKACTLASPAGTAAPGLVGDVTVDMGPARHGEATQPREGGGRRFANVSMGNPHTIAFVDTDEDPETLARTLGPGLETASVYPEGTNVEFAKVRPDGSLLLWVWERGCGITDACGTGACATAAAAVAAGLVPSQTAVEVQLPGGALQITVPGAAGDGVQMRGPARVVFRGELD